MHVLILSPHRDDAAFSCGVLLQELLTAGSSITITNVCTVSGYAPYASANGVETVEQITALRLQEDLAFVEALLRSSGAESSRISLLDLEWQDLPLRWCREDADSLAPTDLRQEEVQSLERCFAALPPCDLVLAPMALGGHLDHRLVSAAALQAFRNALVLFYEDLPYACRISEAERRSSVPVHQDAFVEAWLPIQPTPSSSKNDYARCYPSQIADDVVEEMERYTSENGGRERVLGAQEAIHRLETALRQRGVAA